MLGARLGYALGFYADERPWVGSRPPLPGKPSISERLREAASRLVGEHGEDVLRHQSIAGHRCASASIALWNITPGFPSIPSLPLPLTPRLPVHRHHKSPICFLPLPSSLLCSFFHCLALSCSALLFLPLPYNAFLLPLLSPSFSNVAAEATVVFPLVADVPLSTAMHALSLNAVKSQNLSS